MNPEFPRIVEIIQFTINGVTYTYDATTAKAQAMDDKESQLSQNFEYIRKLALTDEGWATGGNISTFSLTASLLASGAGSVDFVNTGALAGGITAHLPTVAQLVTALGGSPTIGSSFKLRVSSIYSGSAESITLDNGGDSNWTLTGSMAVAQNTCVEFQLTINSLTTATLQRILSHTVAT